MWPQAILAQRVRVGGFLPSLGADLSRETTAKVKVEWAEDGRVGADDADVDFGEAPAYVGGDGPGCVWVSGGAGGEDGTDDAADCGAKGGEMLVRVSGQGVGG